MHQKLSTAGLRPDPPGGAPKSVVSRLGLVANLIVRADISTKQVCQLLLSALRTACSPQTQIRHCFLHVALLTHDVDLALNDFCCFRFVMIHFALTHCYKLESFLT